MKKIRNQPVFFRKMMLFYTLAVTLTIVLLTILFYQSHVSTISIELYKSNEQILEERLQAFWHLEHEMKQLYSVTLAEPSVTSFNTLTSFDPEQNYRAYLAVKKFYHTNPYVSSLYIYNDLNKDTITCGSHEFNVPAGWAHIQEYKKASVILLKSSESETTFLTFAFPIFENSVDFPSGAIFIACEEARLNKAIFSNDLLFGAILDSKNQLLLHNGALSEKANSFFRDSIVEQAKKWVTPEENTSRSQIIHFEGKEYLVSYCSKSDSPFKAISATPYSAVIAPLSMQRNFFLLMALLILILGIVTQYLITRRLYRPIEKITGELRNSVYSPRGEMDEFSLIRHVYEEALDAVTRLEQEKAIYMSPAKTEILRALLLGTDTWNNQQKLFENKENSLPFSGMFLCCFRLESSPENEPFTPIIQSSIQHLVREQLSPHLFVEGLTLGYDQVIFFVNTQEHSETSFSDLIKLIEKAKDSVLKTHDLHLTIALDGVASRIDDLRILYQRAADLLNYRFVLGYNQIIYRKRILDLLPECLSYPEKLEAEIINGLIQGHEEKYQSYIHSFLDILRQYSYQPALLLYNRLYLNLLVSLNKIGVAGHKTNMAFHAETPKTIEEGYMILSDIFSEFQNQKTTASEMKDLKHFKKIQTGKAYVDSHYGDPGLSAGMIAEILGYSTNYFSRLFKTITGFYINDYIRQVRVSHAQQLLLHSDKTIAAIAEETGFTNTSYFYSSFKKNTGLTPSAYRNLDT